MHNNDATVLLTVLCDMHLQGRDPTLMRLVRETGIGADALLPAFDRLAALGLADPERMRLTLAGFAAARALAGARTLAVTRAA